MSYFAYNMATQCCISVKVIVIIVCEKRDEHKYSPRIKGWFLELCKSSDFFIITP